MNQENYQIEKWEYNTCATHKGLTLYLNPIFPSVEKIYKDEEFITDGVFIRWTVNAVEMGNYFTRLICYNGATQTRIQGASKVYALSPDNITKLLEIGCGDPYKLLYFANKGYQCIGIDPSSLATKENIHPNISIINDYFEAYNFNIKFDIIISRFSLEHIIDINKFIALCYDNLNENGLLFIQVPNNDFYINERPPLFASIEHIHYFNNYSLDYLLLKNKFIRYNIYNDKEPSIVGVYRKINNWEDTASKFIDFETNLKVTMSSFLDKHKKIIFYGYGTTFIWLLMIFNLKNFDYQIVDDTELFFGKPVHGTNMVIKQFEKLEVNEDSVFLLCINKIYQDKILKKILNKYENIPVFAISKEGLTKL
jgi:SAM-dependent methyltransferase